MQREHEAAALEQLARQLLAVRDFANTPLQTIETATALARLQPPDTETQLQRIDFERALDRLRVLTPLVVAGGVHPGWRPGPFDAVEKLAGDGDGKADKALGAR